MAINIGKPRPTAKQKPSISLGAIKCKQQVNKSDKPKVARESPNPKAKLNPDQREALAKYSFYQDADFNYKINLLELHKWNPSSYEKIKLLTLSAVESRKPSQVQKVNRFMSGFLLPKDLSSIKAANAVRSLQVVFENYKDSNDVSEIINLFATTDVLIKA
ncbi:hypothetical protein vBVhaSVHB1_50 [Vibrio phage vB_VhaS-VHB1]|nr:hypothetical protein vBVhaSVHB1_50 [Vibrio phage vB_VhaS-VHB1]